MTETHSSKPPGSQSPVFCSFFTPDYAQHALALKASLDHFGLARDVRLVTSRGSWQANCQRKPAFLRAMLDRYGGPVVWIDADARMRQRPDLLLEMAATRHCDAAVYNYGLTGGRLETLSGTVYVDDTPGGRSLLDAWEAACQRRGDAFDQLCLQWSLEEADVRVVELPAEYCFIFDIFRQDFFRHNHPDVGEPVIEHMQAGRGVLEKVRKQEREERKKARGK